MRTSKDYSEEFMFIREELDKILRKIRSKHSVDQILAFDSLTIKKIQIKSHDDIDKSRYDFSILSSESYYDEDGKHLRTRSNIYVKKLTKAEKIGSEMFYNDFLIYSKLVSFFNRHKTLLVDLESFISFKYYENEAIRITNFLYEDVDKQLDFIEVDDEFKSLTELLEREKSQIKQFKDQHSIRLQNKKLKKEI